MPQLSPNPNRAAEKCLADFHGQIPTAQELARASEAFNKKVLVAAHMAALHDAYILEMGFHAGAEAGVGTRPCTYPSAVSEAEHEVFMSGVKCVVSLRDLKVGKVHRRKVVQGSLCARSLKLVRDAVTVLEDEQGNAVSLHVQHPGLANPEFGTATVQTLYPLGSFVAIREPYLTRMPNGTLALLVENPALLAFLSVPPPETAAAVVATANGTLSPQKKLIQARSEGKGKGNIAVANGTLAQKEKEKGNNVAVEEGTLGQQKKNANAATARKTIAQKEKVKGKVTMADGAPAQQKKENANVASLNETLAFQEKEKANTVKASGTLTQQEMEKANLVIADKTLVQQEKEKPNVAIANKVNITTADGTLSQQEMEKANMAMADRTLVQNEEKANVVIANRTLALEEKEKANMSTADGTIAQQNKKKDNAAISDKTLSHNEKEKAYSGIVNQTLVQQENEKADMVMGDGTLTEQEKEKANAAVADKTLVQKEKEIANTTIADVTLTQQEKEKVNPAMAVGTPAQLGKEKANAAVADRTLTHKEKEKADMGFADRTIARKVKEKTITAIADGALIQQEEEVNTAIVDGTLALQEEKANVGMVDGNLINQEKEKANTVMANGTPTQKKNEKANMAMADRTIAQEEEKANMAMADRTLVHQDTEKANVTVGYRSLMVMEKEKANAAMANRNPEPKPVGKSTVKVDEKAQKCSPTVLDNNGSTADGTQNKEKEKVAEDHSKDKEEANRSITATDRDLDMQEEITVERTLSPTDLRLKGNQSFVEEDWNVALQCYSDCIKKAHSENVENELVLGLSNRAELWLKLSKWEEALRDADEALQVKPGHVKSLFRKGRALLGLRRGNEALLLLVEVQKSAPLDKDLKEVLAKCRSLINGKQSKPSQKRRASFAYRNSFKSPAQCA